LAPAPLATISAFASVIDCLELQDNIQQFGDDMSTTPLTLAEGLAEAAHQINTRRPLPELLHNLVSMAGRSLPGVDHVGISITHDGGRIETVAATDDLVLKLDLLQYELDEGPCLSAIREEGMVLVNHADREQRWPRFMERAAALGLRSQMGLRPYANGETVGGLNLYATQSDEIDPEVVHIANLFASHAALALGKARIEENLTQGMTSRQRVGVAIGILMERYELDEDRAFAYLARVSQTSNVKLRDIAEEVVDSANKRNRPPLDAPVPPWQGRRG
jgi:GAF domain-containing protein